MHENERLNGFDWGRNRTHGISMWSEIFTHDSKSGEKIAIILLDTQGLFNALSNGGEKEDSTIFTLSAFASSVQCFNVLREIQATDLQYLNLFSGFASFAEKNKVRNKKLFQRLNFIVRDVPRSKKYTYGWQKDNKMLDHNEKYKITPVYEKIETFYMPSPGDDVVQDMNFNGDLHHVSGNFKKYVSDLANSLFAPQNLVVKQINGQKIRARELAHYLQAHVNILKSNKLPEATIYLQVRLSMSLKFLKRISSIEF